MTHSATPHNAGSLFHSFAKDYSRDTERSERAVSTLTRSAGSGSVLSVIEGLRIPKNQIFRKQAPMFAIGGYEALTNINNKYIISTCMKKYIVAIDIGGTNTKIALVKGFKLKERVSFPTDLCKGSNELVRFILFQMWELLSKAGLERKDIIGIGIGLPGLIDYKKGLVHYLVNVPGWKNVHLTKIIKKITGLDTFIDNDVNIMTLAELYRGNARGSKNVLCITLGTGIGGGIVIDGKLYRGSSYSAGEIGHMTIDFNGQRCNCGNYGCIETFVGNRYIVKKATEQLKKKKNRLLLKFTNGNLDRLTVDRLAKAANRGDKFSKDIWDNVGEYLGAALASVINLLNPDKIVIGGGVSNAGGLLFGPVIKTINKRAMKVPLKHVKILRSNLGEDAGLIGAAGLVMLG